MNYAAQIAYDAQECEGWTDTTLLDVVLDYIANQDSDEAFRDYLTERGAESAETAAVDHDWISETLCKCGAQFGSPRSMTAHMEWANAAEVDPCDVPEADQPEPDEAEIREFRGACQQIRNSPLAQLCSHALAGDPVALVRVTSIMRGQGDPGIGSAKLAAGVRFTAETLTTDDPNNP